jgi:hypothetical protein
VWINSGSGKKFFDMLRRLIQQLNEKVVESYRLRAGKRLVVGEKESRKGRMEDALALKGEEGRDKLR